MNSDILLLLPAHIQEKDVFWKDSAARDLFTTLIRKLTDVPFPLLVLGEDRDFLDIAESFGVDTLDMTFPEESDDSFLPPGTESAVFHALDAGYSPSVFAALNFRNPNIPELIAEAFKSFQRNPAMPLVSVKSTRDNPCQLITAFEIVAAGIIRNDNGQYQALPLAGDDSRFIQLTEAGPVFRKMSSTKDDITVAVLRNCGRKGQTEFPQFGLPVLPPENGQEIIWVILAPSKDGRLDLQLPFVPFSGEWRYSSSNQTITCGNCRLIGRQQFPEVRVFDGSFAIWENTDKQVRGILSDFLADCFALNPKQSTIINNRIDYHIWMIDNDK